jgi:hypothetical protein
MLEEIDASWNHWSIVLHIDAAQASASSNKELKKGRAREGLMEQKGAPRQ